MSICSVALLLGADAVGVEAPPPAAPRVWHPQTQDAGELNAAFVAADPAQAVSLLSHFTCAAYENIDAVEVVGESWDRRDSTGATGATRDPVVRTLMARCLAEFKPRFSPPAPEDAPALAQLRLALGSSDPEQVRAAARGLTNTASAEDVKALVAAANRLPSLRTEIVTDLGQICRVDAVAAADMIEAGIKDKRERSNIDNIVSHSEKTRRLMCGYDANIVGREVSQTDIDDFSNTSHSETGHAPIDIKGLLTSTNVQEARQMLNALHCRSDEKETAHVVEEAWQHRNSGPNDLATRDFGIRVLMAKCLIDASATDNSKIPGSVIEQLRQAVKNGNHFDFIVAVEGLAPSAAAPDIELIEKGTQGRPSVIADMVVQLLTRTCAPGAQQAVAGIRARTTATHAAHDMDYSIGATKRVREYVCGKEGSGGNLK